MGERNGDETRSADHESRAALTAAEAVARKGNHQDVTTESSGEEI